ncbi:hypothetical protein F4804DRAFT_351776 [Jackrogersella minutella]|nr:hypothetical protein F4804DRAFT_351776 [Jackrogersella minutella]
MCRRILTHRMHHDVRTPMVTDIYADDPSIYVNSRHTCYHQCELSHPVPDQWLLCSPYPSCPYHSCCVLSVEVEFCADHCALVSSRLGIAYPEGECEPEECASFVLEHLHERLEYFGHPEAYSTSYPATWREDMQYFECDWQPWFKQDKTLLTKWEELLYLECENLYTLEQDAKTQFLAYRDLTQVWPSGHQQLDIAETNVEHTQTRLLEKKESIACLMNWAQGFRPECISGFIPIWWMRMWALKQETCKE